MKTRYLFLLGMAGLARLAVLHGADEETAMMGAAKLDPKHVEFFEKKIQPLFKENCYKCHSVEAGKSKGGLTLDTREGLAKGGETGGLIKPGDPDKSLMITAVSYKDPDLQMPPKGEKLTKEQIADLTEWVKMGAPDPRKPSSAAVASKLSGLTEKARSHWAYQPVKKPTKFPTVKTVSWLANPATPNSFNPVDAFVLQKIEEKGMTPSPWLMETEAGRMTLLRRATYDLTGLPPTTQEQDEFILDKSPNAFAKVVDRLLASPHYGERWGRFWLDSARYADTIGGDRGDNNRADYRYPFAWTYRDWVIKAMNADLPYDQFIKQQLAADLIPKNSVENLAALGFLTVGERFGNPNDVINDRIDVVSKGFLAMTVACARCHDHMFDPIPTTDYYALHGVFASITEPREKPLISPPEKKALLEDFEKQLAVMEQENRDKFYQMAGDYNNMFLPKAEAYLVAAYKGRGSASAEDQLAAAALIKDQNLEREMVNQLRGEMNRDDAVFGPLKRFADGGDSWKEIAKVIVANKSKKYNPIVAAAFAGAAPNNFPDLFAIYGKIFAQVADKERDYVKAAATTKSGPVSGFDQATAQLLNTPFDIPPAGELNTDGVREMSNRWPLQMRGKAGFIFAKINNLLLTHDGAPKRAMVVKDKDHPENTAVMIRGQAETRGDVVPRRFLEVLSPGGKPAPFKVGSGRLELAEAIASKNNPLTARVIVNRVWMHHFGEGFVRTPDDLGTQAEPPTHPELLDYLASYFMEQGWSFKKLHKLIMLSKAYQEDCKPGKPELLNAYAAIDPENRLLWRANVRRLDFEAVRDTLLALSGKLECLELSPKGPVHLKCDHTLGGQPVNLTDEPYSYRRSVYGYIDRGNVPELMAHFDFSRPDMPNSKRTTTVVPQQALFLMNSPMSADTARSIMQRPDITKAITNGERVNAIYKVVFQRSPHQGEVPLAFAFVGEEKKLEPQLAQASKEVSEKAAKSAQERFDNMMKRDNDAVRAIQNEGQLVERTPLTPWETFVQALLLSNEAAYVN
jgi:hypothetical protein